MPYRAADPLGLSGPEGSRRRGALLRRLLALGDWTALIVALFAVTAATSSTDVADLFWAVLFSPSWILVVKLHGLYDNDHRRIRHSTLDEVPSLVSATVLGTLVLDGLLAISPVGPLSPKSAIALGVGTLVGSFVLRGVLRWIWHRATPMAIGIVIGPPPPSTPSPAASSPTRRRACTWSATSPTRPRRTRPSCPASAASPTSPRSPSRGRSSASSSPNSR